MRATRATMRSMPATVTGTVCCFGPGRGEPDDGAGLVDEIDGAIRQPIVAEVPGRQPGRRLERRIVVLDAMVLLVAAAQTGEDPDRLFDRRFIDRNFLETAGERAILFDLFELLERRRADDPQVAGRQDRLQQRREIHGAARDRAGADQWIRDGRLALFSAPAAFRPEIAAERGERARCVEREDHALS